MSEMIFKEADFFITSFGYGVFLLAVYDMLRIFRRTVTHGKSSVAVEDLLFWMIGSVLVFRMIYGKNDGIIRGTGFLSMGLGMAAYHMTISKYVVKIGYGILGKPIRKLYTIVCKGLKKIRKAVKLIYRSKG